jgi:hypothetical protein
MKPGDRIGSEPSEAAFTRMVIQMARLFGWRCAHFRASMNRRGKWSTAVQGDGAGFPDLLLVNAKAGRTIAAELKVGRNKPTQEQTLWLAAFAQAGIEAVVWYPSQWGEIETALKSVG